MRMDAQAAQWDRSIKGDDRSVAPTSAPTGSEPAAAVASPALFVPPIPIDVAVPDGYWEHDASHFPRASYPVDSVVIGLIEAAMKRWVGEFGYLFDGIEFRDIGGWTYQRLRPIDDSAGPPLPSWLMWLLVRTVPTMRARVAVARDAVRTDKPGRFIQRWHERWLPELAVRIDELLHVDRGSLGDAELEEHIDQVIGLVGRGIEVHTLLHGSLAPILFELVSTCERLLGWGMAESLELVRGTSFKSTEPARRLHELALMASLRPMLLEPHELPESRIVAWLREVDGSFARAFSDYLDTYGHRVLGDSIAEPTVSERPSFVLGLVRDQLTSGYDPEAVDDANARARDLATDLARRQLLSRPEAAASFERVLERAREAYPAREDNEFYTLSAPFALLRYSVLELGTRLRRDDVLGDREDVLFLSLTEARAALDDGLDRRALVARRQGERAWAIANPGPRSYGSEPAVPSSMAFLPADARLPMESMLWSLESMFALAASSDVQPSRPLLRGIGVSAGSYTGPVRIVRSVSQFDKVRAGDVLVCPITSPVWSLLFPTIGALVTDAGGILSHPAIIAREYRIPAVVATGNATTQLEDGQTATVDGSVGTVVT